MSDIKRVWTAKELWDKVTDLGRQGSEEDEDLCEYLAQCTRLMSVLHSKSFKEGTKQLRQYRDSLDKASDEYRKVSYTIQDYAGATLIAFVLSENPEMLAALEEGEDK